MYQYCLRTKAARRLPLRRCGTTTAMRRASAHCCGALPPQRPPPSCKPPPLHRRPRSLFPAFLSFLVCGKKRGYTAKKKKHQSIHEVTYICGRNIFKGCFKDFVPKQKKIVGSNSRKIGANVRFQ